MLDSKLVESIKALNSVEKNEFASFLDSRFFQREYSVQQLKQLLALILAALKTPEKADLSKPGVHEAIFPDKPFAENRVDRIMFELNRLLKTFLLVKHYLREENELEQTLDWSEMQRSKGLDVNFEKQLQRLKQEQDNKNKAFTDTSFEQYLIAKEAHEWHSMFNKAKGDLGIPQAIEALDFFYFTQKLEMLNRFLLQQRISPLETPEIIQVSSKMNEVPNYYLAQSPVLFITLKINQLFNDPHPSVLGVQQLMDLLSTNEPQLPPSILAQFYAYLRNFCTLLFDAGNTDFDKIIHEIQQDNLSRGYFYQEGKIHPNAYLNITQMAIRVQNLPWAYEFVQSHKNKIIGENETHDFFNMNLALCLFAESRFEEALKIIPFGSANSAYHLMARRLELKIFYELHSTVLPSKIDAFKMFINRSGNKSFPKNLVELFTNFVNFVHQLHLSIPGDKKRSETLLRRIQEKKLVGERSWLLEKARDLGNGRI